MKEEEIVEIDNFDTHKRQTENRQIIPAAVFSGIDVKTIDENGWAHCHVPVEKQDIEFLRKTLLTDDFTTEDIFRYGFNHWFNEQQQDLITEDNALEANEEEEEEK
eukprot:Nk52_evm8s586 gene=Nk52_evmTU8s586